MGFDKLAAPLGGVPVLVRSMRAFEACAVVGDYRIVTAPERFAALREAAEREGFAKFSGLVAGGAERHLSVHRGLESLGERGGRVAVHDGARPLVTPEAIRRCAEVAESCGAAALAHRIVETVKRADAEGTVRDSVSREGLWAMETPQIFDLALLRRAYAEVLACGEAVTDEVSAVMALGHPVRLVENAAPNPKITVPADLDLAEALLPQ